MQKLKVTLKITLNKETIEETGVVAEKIAEGLRLYSDDVVDGFLLTTDIRGYDNSVDFFLTREAL